jgi:hypothetical protein
MATLTEISCSKLLLVEGSDEECFWTAVLDVRAIGDIQVYGIGGKDKIRPNLKAVRNTPGFDDVRWLGVVQDADDDADAACDRIRGALRDAGLPFPDECWRLEPGDLTVVACVLPGGGDTGNLELLVKRSLASQPAAACVDAYLECCGSAGSGKFWKAWVHAYLASLDPPDKRLGHAALGGLLDLRSPVFDDLVSLIP